MRIIIPNIILPIFKKFNWIELNRILGWLLKPRLVEFQDLDKLFYEVFKDKNLDKILT